MRVSRWGNSLAIRLPAAVVEVLQLKEGDEIEVTVKGSGSTGAVQHGTEQLEIERKLSREEAIERLRKFRGMLPADFKFDRGWANSR